MKKITLLFICIVSVLNIGAATYSGSCGDNVSYTLDTETGLLFITGTGAMNKYPYSGSNAPWISKRYYIKTVDIADGVTTIGSNAFVDCSGLTSITIPNSVTSIGDQAFAGCSSLTSITIPNSVTSIGNHVFGSCSGLISMTIGNGVTSIGDNAFSSCSGLTSVHITDLEAWCKIKFSNSISNPLCYAHHFYLNDGEINDLEIPNSVTEIGNYAFSSCSGLKSITFSNSVKEIGNYAFSSCSGLTSITFSNSVTKIGNYAFSSCSGLTSITFSNSVTKIGKYAFSGCSGLTSITIPNSVTSIEEGVFRECSSLASITIPNSVTSIETYAFSNTSLKTLIVGTGMLSIGYNSFSTKPIKTIWLTNTPPQGYKNAQGTVNYVANSQYGDLNNLMEYKFLSSMFEVDGLRYVPVSPSERTCDVFDCVYDNSVTGVSINPTVSYKGVSMKVQNVQPYTFYKNTNIMKASFDIDGSIGKSVFYGCTNLQSTLLGQYVTGIGEDAFYGCSKLESITIPESVYTIGKNAFSDCTGMKSVVIGNSTKIIDQYAFSNCTSLTSLKIGEGTNTIGNYAFSCCSSLQSISLGEGTVTIGDNTFSGCSKLPKIVIPGSVNSIGNYAFCGCTGLKTVIMADRLTEGELKLGCNGSNPLFVDCLLDSVYIGRNLSYSTESYYGYSPFYRNTTLRSISITDKETEISANEFYGCTNLQNVQIGDGVTSIGNWAFSGCSSLKNFSFGTQVQTIGKEAFSDCTTVTAIISNAKTPPTCGTQALDDINKWDCVLYVPKGYVSDYQATDQWKDFFFIEEIKPVLRGDVNGDDVVNGTDIQAIINLIVESQYDKKGDVNEDGIVNGTDIQEVIKIIVTGEYEDEGELYDNYIFEDSTYGNADNDCAPKAESGWEIWLNGERRTPGGNYIYNGSRIYADLAMKGLKVGFYCGDEYSYIIYGTGELEGAPKLTLPAGSLDITYYASNWQAGEARDIHFQIMDANDRVVADNVTYTSENKGMGGMRNAEIEAEKITFTWNCPVNGQYKIKLSSTAGKVLIGNISIVQKKQQ